LEKLLLAPGMGKNFPKLTSDRLKLPLDSMISEIRHTNDPEGLHGEVFESISFGK